MKYFPILICLTIFCACSEDSKFNSNYAGELLLTEQFRELEFQILSDSTIRKISNYSGDLLTNKEPTDNEQLSEFLTRSGIRLILVNHDQRFIDFAFRGATPIGNGYGIFRHSTDYQPSQLEKRAYELIKIDSTHTFYVEQSL